MGCETREKQGRDKQLRETVVQPWDRVLVPLQGIHTTIYLSCCAETETHTRWEKLTVNEGVLPTSTETPDCLEPEGWWCRLPLTSPPTRQRNVPELITPSLTHYYKTSQYPFQVGTHSFEDISLPWPPLPGKAIKLFFSTSPQTLSPRFNSVSGYRGRIQLQEWVRLGLQSRVGR